MTRDGAVDPYAKLTEMMSNPLRLPLVLIIVFATMLTYVHQHHRQQARDTDPPLFEHEDESLQLRQSAGPQERATLVGPSSFDSPTARPAAPQESAGGDAAAARLPGLNDPTAPIQGPSPAVVTLWPPDSAYARFQGPSSTAHQRPSGDVGRSAPPSSVTPTPSTPDALPHEVMHRIVDGDTLPALAETYLGDASRYGELLEANRDVLVHPDLLPLGIRIRIPLAPHLAHPRKRGGE